MDFKLVENASTIHNKVFLLQKVNALKATGNANMAKAAGHHPPGLRFLSKLWDDPGNTQIIEKLYII